ILLLHCVLYILYLLLLIIMVFCLYLFFFTVPLPTEIYTLSLHDALPIFVKIILIIILLVIIINKFIPAKDINQITMKELREQLRSEEHTSELQSRFDLVCRLLLEKKKN